MQIFHNNISLAHAWANQNVDSGRNSNESFYFIGSSIYSYGSHFEIARYVGDRILFNKNKYSVTTSAHQNHVLNSIYGNVIYVSGKDSDLSDHKANLSAWSDYIIYLSDKLQKSRKPEIYLSKLDSLKLNILEYLDLYSKEIKKSSLSKALKDFLYTEISNKEDFTDISTGLIKYKKSLSSRIARRKAQEYERQKKQDADLTKKLLTKFYNYEINNVNTNHDIELRLSKDGQHIETSRGASVPFREGFLLYSLSIIHRKKQIYKNYQNQRVIIGDFNLTFIDKKGNTRVNCHYLKHEKMARLYEQIALDLTYKHIVSQYRNLFARLSKKLTRDI